VLSEKEWASWNTKARDILKSDTGFGISPDNIDIFTLRERSISISEKLYNEFKAERTFFDRIATIRSFASQKDAELDSEYFAEMFSYLTSFLKTSNQTGEQSIAAYLLIKELMVKHPHLGANLPLKFADIIKGISDIPGLFQNLKDNRLKEEFLHHLQMFIPEWADIFVELFPRTMLATIISQLEKEGYSEKLTAMTLDCFDHFRERREAVVWLIKNAVGTDWFKAANISIERQLIVLIHVLDLTYRDIENQRETTDARKINKQVYTILFKDDVLGSFIDNAGDDTITRIYTFINDVKNLDPQDKINLKSRIQDHHPDFKFSESVEKRTSQGLTVTRIKFDEKQKQLAHIMDVEVPANSREIEAARLHGDLKENAEYIAAKEKQVLLNTTAERLKEDIDRAQIFDPATIDTSRVSFGTVVVLQNESKDRKEEYTLLGPWESEPEHNIISYQTPFGKAMLSKTVGEHFNFLSDGEKNLYTVEAIKAASI
jgi:transcription elongation factor GreA